MKGQISIDLIFTIIVVLIFISGTTIIFNEIKQNNELIILQNNLLISANNYSTLIKTSQILEDFNFEIRMKLDEIYYKNEKKKPLLTINDNNLLLEIENIQKIFVKIPENDLNISQENNFLVIKND